METGFNEEIFLSNLSKITRKKKLNKIFDAEIFTDVFSKMNPKDFEDIKYKLVNRQIRNKVFDNAKILGCFNVMLDATRYQKAHYEVHPEMLHQTKEGITTWYQAVEELKLVVNGMAISMCTEIIRNTDGEDKQDCEINAMKRLLPKLHKYFPRLNLRIIGDGLYACKTFFNLCKQYNWEYIAVLQDKRIPRLIEEYEILVGREKDNIIFEKNSNEIKVIQWVNNINYENILVNVMEEITYNIEKNKQTRWVWVTNRIVTKDNVKKLINIAKNRSYIENQGFREQKITTGLNLEHVYSKNFVAMQIIYQLLQISHMILQYIEHSDIVKNFKKRYGSVKVFSKKLYSKLILDKLSELDLKILLESKIQIRFYSN